MTVFLITMVTVLISAVTYNLVGEYQVSRRRQFITSACVGVLLASLLIVWQVRIADLRYESVTVTSVTSSSVELTDETGNVWEWLEESSHFQAGQKVEITFCRQWTESIYDDAIVRIEAGV